MQLHKIPLSNHVHQEMVIPFNGRNIRLTIRFNSIGQFWAMSVFDLSENKSVMEGMAMVCGVPLLVRSAQPYFFWVEDNSGNTLDPMFETDFNGRCSLYIGEK
nr:MAG TPA: hypothetical protein [Caudoviricetes sp.]